MNRLHLTSVLGIGLVVLLGGCATRPVNPPIAQADPGAGYRYEARQSRSKDSSEVAMEILAVSGGDIGAKVVADPKGSGTESKTPPAR